MFRDRANRLHFIGIGGIGMSGIAEVLVNLGYDVRGSDIARSAVTARVAVTQAQVAEIESLVSSAAGIDTARGDTLAVSRLAFDTTIEEALAANVEAGGGGVLAPASGGGMMSSGSLVVMNVHPAAL